MRCLIFAVVALVLAQNAAGVPHLGKRLEVSLGQINPRYERVFETTINETMECIRYTLEFGLPELGIPSLETITIEEFNLDLGILGMPEASGFVNTNNIVVKGLAGFYATALKGTITVIPLGYAIEGTLWIPHLSVSTGYDMDLVGNGIPVYGKGAASIELNDVTLDIKTSIGITGGINVRDLSMLVHVGSANTQITGWYNDDEHSQVISDLVNDFLIPAWINQQPEDINDLVSPFLLELINYFLANSGEGGEGGEGGEEGEESIIDIILANCEAREPETKL